MIRKLAPIAVTAILLAIHPAFAGSDLHSCMVDVCGTEESASGLKAGGLFGSAESESVKSFLDGDFDPRIAMLADENIRIANAIYLPSSFQITQASVNSMSAEQLSLALSRSFSEIYSDQIHDATFLDSEGNAQLSVDQLVKSIPDLDRQDLYDLAALTGSSIASTEYYLAMYVSRASYPSLIDLLLHGSPAEKAKKWDVVIGSFAAAARSLNSKVSPLLSSEYELALLERARKNPKFSLADQALLTKMIARTMRMSSEIAPAATAKLTPNLKNHAVVLLNRFLPQLSKDFLLGAEKTSSEELKSQIVAQCRVSAKRAIAASPSPLRFKQSTLLLNNLKSTAKAAAKEYLSGRALSAAVSSIDQLSFDLPIDAETRRNSLEDFLDKAQIVANSRLQILSAPSKNQRLQNLLYTIVKRPDSFSDAVQMGMNSICDSLAPKPFVDAAYSDSHLVRISWATMIFPEYGAGIIAHEIGHIVSSSVEKARAIEITRYRNARACTRKLHSALADPDAGPRDEEEDWADTFSSSTLKLFRQRWPFGKNLGCAVSAFDESDAGLWSNLELSTQDNSKIHSTSFLRALRVQTELGNQLPTSCKEALGPKAESIEASHCSL